MSRRVMLMWLVLVLTACAGAPDVPVSTSADQASTAIASTSGGAAANPVGAATEVAAAATPEVGSASLTAYPVDATASSTPSSLPTSTTSPTPEPSPTTPPDATQVVGADITDTPNDLPELTETQAPVVELPTPELVRVVAEPLRITIPAIGVDAQPISVGLDSLRVPVVPKHSIGWYNLGARPGQGENVVMWGHVLRFRDSPNVPAPFARVKELLPGAMISVTTTDGVVHRYRVTQQLQVNPTQVRYILPVGSERLTLVSCIGDKVVENGFITKKFRLVTIAEPVA